MKSCIRGFSAVGMPSAAKYCGAAKYAGSSVRRRSPCRTERSTPSTWHPKGTAHSTTGAGSGCCLVLAMVGPLIDLVDLRAIKLPVPEKFGRERRHQLTKHSLGHDTCDGGS